MRFVVGSLNLLSNPHSSFWPSLVVLAAAAQLAACTVDAGDLVPNPNAGGGGVDPADPDALSGVLVIPGAVRVTGALPAPAASGTADAPMISNVEPQLEVMSGKQAVVRLTFRSPSGYRSCYVQVDGADDYFRIDGNDSTAEGELQIPVNVPSSVCSGNFSFSSRIAGSNGLVSNNIGTSIRIQGSIVCGGSSSTAGNGGAGGSSGGGGESSCAAACQRIVANAPCYADGMDGCLEDCGQNRAMCPMQVSAVNACVLSTTPACDGEGRLTIPGCGAQAQAVKDCSGDSAY